MSQLFRIMLWQTLNSISAEKNSTIIFPIPIDVISTLMGGGGGGGNNPSSSKSSSSAQSPPGRKRE